MAEAQQVAGDPRLRVGEERQQVDLGIPEVVPLVRLRGEALGGDAGPVGSPGRLADLEQVPANRLPDSRGPRRALAGGDDDVGTIPELVELRALGGEQRVGPVAARAVERAPGPGDQLGRGSRAGGLVGDVLGDPDRDARPGLRRQHRLSHVRVEAHAQIGVRRGLEHVIDPDGQRHVAVGGLVARAACGSRSSRPPGRSGRGSGASSRGVGRAHRDARARGAGARPGGSGSATRSRPAPSARAARPRRSRPSDAGARATRSGTSGPSPACQPGSPTGALGSASRRACRGCGRTASSARWRRTAARRRRTGGTPSRPARSRSSGPSGPGRTPPRRGGSATPRGSRSRTRRVRAPDGPRRTCRARRRTRSRARTRSRTARSTRR